VSDVGPPPPPPPSLTPPPGYAAYQPNLSAAVPLRRVRGLGTAIVVLLGIYSLAAILQAATIPRSVDAARDLLADRIDDDKFTEDLTPFTLSSFLTSAATLAIVVLTIIWLFRVAANHRSIGRQLSWAPGWAIGGWFLPPFILYVIPMLMLRESWKAADPSVPPTDQRWRQSAVNPVVYVWWVLYGLVPIVFLVSGLTFQRSTFGGNERDIADAIEDQQGFMIAQVLSGVAAAVAFALLVRWLTMRHSRLTGESGGR
jgi:hypothetical protein